MVLNVLKLKTVYLNVRNLCLNVICTQSHLDNLVICEDDQILIWPTEG